MEFYLIYPWFSKFAVFFYTGIASQTSTRHICIKLCQIDTGIIILKIRVITKLPNSEQSYKGKVKTHKYINRKKQSTTGKL